LPRRRGLSSHFPTTTARYRHLTFVTTPHAAFSSVPLLYRRWRIAGTCYCGAYRTHLATERAPLFVYLNCHSCLPSKERGRLGGKAHRLLVSPPHGRRASRGSSGNPSCRGRLPACVFSDLMVCCRPVCLHARIPLRARYAAVPARHYAATRLAFHIPAPPRHHSTGLPPHTADPWTTGTLADDRRLDGRAKDENLRQRAGDTAAALPRPRPHYTAIGLSLYRRLHALPLPASQGLFFCRHRAAPRAHATRTTRRRRCSLPNLSHASFLHAPAGRGGIRQQGARDSLELWQTSFCWRLSGRVWNRWRAPCSPARPHPPCPPRRRLVPHRYSRPLCLARWQRLALAEHTLLPHVPPCHLRISPRILA